MIKKSTLFLGALFGFGATIQAQEFFNNGGTVQINNIVTFVNGGIENNSAGTIVNDGNFWSTNNGIAPGHLTLNGGSTTSGTGKFYVEQNFVNNANWNGAGNEVLMNSNAANQNITGTSPTSFFHLTLTNSTAVYPNPKVLMGINITVTDSLWLNNRELATQANILTVTSPTNGAITNNPTQGSEGFISSVAPGYTEWQTANATPYFFPLGSSQGTLRYRPLEITPSAAAADNFDVRFNNNDATVDGYNRANKDTTFCFSNPKWYHTIDRSVGVTASDVKIYFDPAADGANWSGIAQYQTPANQWNNIQPTTAGAVSYFSTQVKPTWAFAGTAPQYILIENRPQTPTVNCPAAVCSNAPAASLTATGSSATNYQWTVSGGTTIVSGQGTSTINVLLGGNNPVEVVASNAAGTCFSSSAACTNIVVNQAPNAGFTDAVSATDQMTYLFHDTTSGGPFTTESWNIDGTTYTGANPQNTFSAPGTFPVTLIVTNSLGCTDTVNSSITVDYNEVIIVPNVITPNGDGINDEFFITNSGFKDFKFTIYNRWGQVMYTAESASFHWDGKNTSGDAVSDGTYYWMLKGTFLDGKAIEKEGYLMVYKTTK
jgi:gliding motility-associated-like protein